MTFTAMPVNMKKILLIAVCLTGLQCCVNNNRTSSDGETRGLAERAADKYKKMPFFPAEIVYGEGRYAVQVTAITSAFFAEEFDNEGLYGNGYCWAGVIEQLLEQKNPKLLSKVTFDPEADTCFMRCADEDAMNELARQINEYCSTREKLRDLLDSVIDKGELDC